jgi:hypothetical protein
MPKRPWDRGFAASLFKKEDPAPPYPPRKDEGDNTGIIRQTAASAVAVDGVEFYSDRFYLNRPEGVTEDDVSKIAVPPPYNGAPSCSCGARGPPPLLDRGRLVESLSLKAAVLSTFPFDPISMAKEMPSLFGPTGNVPTLVLHGDKRFRKWLREKEEENSSPTKRAKLHEPESSDDEEETEISKARTGLAKAGQMEAIVKTPQIKKEEEPPEEAFLRMRETVALDDVETCLGQAVHVTEILPMWLSPHAKRRISRQPSDSTGSKSDVVVLDDSDDESGQQDSSVQGVSSAVVKHRTRRPGVHHPKYMILFETSGSVIVVVSTCNLTRQTSADASWLQRFPAHSIAGTSGPVTDTMRRDGSDFGYVLADYLECQSNAAQKDQMIPQEFLKKYLGYESLEAFRAGFRFEDSSVHLIATVPGEYRGCHGATHLDTRNEQPFLYGAQRVADVVSRLTQHAKTKTTGQEKPWLPSALLSSEDRLVIQPTSFGGFWTGTSLAAIGRLYLGIDVKEGKPWSSRDTDILNRTDIVWPSMDFLRNLNKKRKSRRVASPDSVAEETMPAASSDESGAKLPLSFLFMSSASFNTCELSSLSCMAMYESSVPMQLPLLLGPHIKSCIRLFEGNEYQLRKEYGTEKAEEIIPYALLTSACLSRGAQGQPYPPGSFDTGDRTYFNFELGVLFTSRLTGDRESDRQYCYKPIGCSCDKDKHRVKDQRVKMIHLPFPFCLRPQSFQPDPEEADMCATPFMHEIPKGTGFVGNMKLTPLGVKYAAKQK